MHETVLHVVLAISILALADAALRVAGRTGAVGLERALAAAAIGVATAIIEALALGLLSIGSSPVALASAAGATWLGVRLALPAPEPRLGHELRTWWSGLTVGARVAAAALAGAGAAWLIWHLRFPALGFDSTVYHYGNIAGWIDNGRPGSAIDLSYEIPYGNYPLTDEVAQAWGVGIARSWVPIALWNPALLVLLGAASWQTLRNLAVPRLHAALATAFLILSLIHI